MSTTEQRNPALYRLGYFGESSYISIGEPYDTKRAGSTLTFVNTVTKGIVLSTLRSTSLILVRFSERKIADDNSPPVFRLSTNNTKVSNPYTLSHSESCTTDP
jgi:hypothetical protein